MKAVILENTWLTRGLMDFGWGNGYVLIPIGHKLHGKHYDDINVSVHGGLTYSELITEEIIKHFGLDVEDIGKWAIGFDTVHYGDSLDVWTKEKVEEETDNLLKQLQEL